MTSDIETTKTVVAIQGISVESGTPLDRDILTYVESEDQWQHQSLSQIDGYGLNEFTSSGTITSFLSSENVLGQQTNVPIKEFTGDSPPDGTSNLLSSYTVPFGVQSWDISVLGVDTTNSSNVYRSDLHFMTTNQPLLSMLPTGPSPTNIISAGSATEWFPIATTMGGAVNIYGNGATGTHWGIYGKVQHILIPFTPTNITGCELWLRADLGITSSSGNVSQWSDQSGTGDSNKNVSSSGAACPTYNTIDPTYNNQSILSFDESNSQQMTSGTWAYPLSSPYTVFVVGNSTIPETNPCSFDIYQSGNRLSFIIEDTGNTLVYNGGGAISGNWENPNIVASTVNGASSNAWFSQLTAGSSNTSGNPIMTGTIIGNANTSPSQNWNGKIAEVIVYNSILSTQDFNTVMNYLGKRYGITIGL
jgi:hypothetical protein